MDQSWLAITLLVSGTILALLVFTLFTTKKRYLRSDKPDRGVGFVQERLAAEEKLVSIAPELLQASDREKALTASLKSGSSLDKNRDVARLVREADVSGLWRSFGTASALIEDDPEMARETLETLSSSTQTALERLAEAGGLISEEVRRGR